MSAVQRLVTNAEEVAFNDDSLPSGKSEEMVLNWHLSRMVKHSSLSAFQRFVQQVFDGFAVKYMASAVALLLYAAPLYFKDPSLRGTQADITQDYIRAMRLLQNTSRQVCLLPATFLQGLYAQVLTARTSSPTCQARCKHRWSSRVAHYGHWDEAVCSGTGV